jgi:hypothetical protein
MQHRRHAYPLLVVLSLCAFSPAVRKVGIRVSVTAVGADSVALSVTGSLMNVGAPVRKCAIRFTAAAPYLTTTPVELMPLDLRDTLVIAAPVGAAIKVAADNLITHEHLECTGRIIRSSREDGQTQVKLTPTP